MRETFRIISLEVTNGERIALATKSGSAQIVVADVEDGNVLWGYALLQDTDPPRVDKSRWLIGIPSVRIDSIGIDMHTMELEVVTEKRELKAVPDEKE